MPILKTRNSSEDAQNFHWAPVCCSKISQSRFRVDASSVALAILLGLCETLYWPVTPSIDGSVIILYSSFALCSKNVLLQHELLVSVHYRQKKLLSVTSSFHELHQTRHGRLWISSAHSATTLTLIYMQGSLFIPSLPFLQQAMKACAHRNFNCASHWKERHNWRCQEECDGLPVDQCHKGPSQRTAFWCSQSLGLSSLQ